MTREIHRRDPVLSPSPDLESVGAFSRVAPPPDEADQPSRRGQCRPNDPVACMPCSTPAPASRTPMCGRCGIWWVKTLVSTLPCVPAAIHTACGNGSNCTVASSCRSPNSPRMPSRRSAELTRLERNRVLQWSKTSIKWVIGPLLLTMAPYGPSRG